MRTMNKKISWIAAVIVAGAAVVQAALYTEDFTTSPTPQHQGIAAYTVGTDNLGWVITPSQSFSAGVMAFAPLGDGVSTRSLHPSMLISLDGVAAGDYSASFDVGSFVLDGVSTTVNSFGVGLLTGMGTLATGNTVNLDPQFNTIKLNPNVVTAGTASYVQLVSQAEFSANGTVSVDFTLDSLGSASDVLLLTWITTESGDGLTDSFTVDNINVAIPEPATLGMLGLGALSVIVIRRRF